MSAAVSSGSARMSDSGSASISNGIGSVSRPNVSQNHPYSTPPRCLTSPRRLVPEETTRRRSCSSSRPSSFHSTTARCRASPCSRIVRSSAVRTFAVVMGRRYAVRASERLRQELVGAVEQRTAFWLESAEGGSLPEELGRAAPVAVAGGEVGLRGDGDRVVIEGPTSARLGEQRQPRRRSVRVAVGHGTVQLDHRRGLYPGKFVVPVRDR